MLAATNGLQCGMVWRYLEGNDLLKEVYSDRRQIVKNVAFIDDRQLFFLCCVSMHGAQLHTFQLLMQIFLLKVS